MTTEDAVWTPETIRATQVWMKSLDGSRDDKFKLLQVITNQVADHAIWKGKDVVHLNTDGKYIKRRYYLYDIGHIKHPPKYAHEWKPHPVMGYPDTETCPGYLVNFDIRDVVIQRSSLSDKGKEDTAEYYSLNFAYELYREATNQARIASIVEICIAFIFTSLSHGVKCHSITYLDGLIKDFARSPFNSTSRGTYVYEDSEVSSSLLPLLMLQCCSLMQARIGGSITEYEEMLALNTATKFTRLGYQSTYLSNKSVGRGWLTTYYEFHSQGFRIAPQWSIFNKFIGYRSTYYGCFISKSVVDDYLAKLLKSDLLDEHKAYIMEMNKPVTAWIAQSRLVACRYITNPGTHYITAPVLALRDAIGPKLNFPVQRLQPKKAIRMDDGTVQVIEPQRIKGTLIYRVWKYLEDAILIAAQKISTRHLQSDFIDQLSSRSAGRDLSEDVVTTSSESTFLRFGRIRIFNFVLQVDYFMSWNSVSDFLTSAILIAIRYQLDRRMRTIAGVDNFKIASGIPVRYAEEYILKHLDISSSGKTKGNYIDNIHNIKGTSFGKNTTVLSTDISGMDASQQRTVTDMANCIAFNVLSKATNKQQPYLCAQPCTFKVHCYDEKGNIIGSDLLPVSGALHYVLRSKGAAGMRATLTTVDGFLETKTFGAASKFTQPVKIQNSDQTFPSGLAETASSNTLVVACAVGSARVRFEEEFKRPPPVIKQVGVGDDLSIIIYGDDATSKRFTELLFDEFRAIGFKIDDAASTRFGEYLQQAAYEGRVLAYPDRVSFATVERNDPGISPIAKHDQLMALLIDVGNRIPFPDKLKDYILYLFIVSIGVIKISSVVSEETARACALEIVKRMLGRIIIRFVLNDVQQQVIIDTESFTGDIYSQIMSYRDKEKVRLILVLYPPVHTACTWSSYNFPPRATKCVDGRVTDRFSYYMPSGDMVEWWKFQVLISQDKFDRTSDLGNSYTHISAPERLCDVQYAKDMGFDLAHAIKILLERNRLEELRNDSSTDEEKRLLAVYSNRLKNLRDQRSLMLSAVSANTLEHEYGVVVPNSMLYASRDEARLQATWLQSKAQRSEQFTLRSGALKGLAEFALRSGSSTFTSKVGNEAKMLLFMIDWIEDSLEHTRDYENLKRVGFLSPELRHGSLLSGPWLRVNHNDQLASSSSLTALLLADNYSAWKLTTQLLDWIKAHRNKLRSGRSIDLLLQAVGANPNLREAVIEYIRRLDDTDDAIRFAIRVAPRQFYMYDGHPIVAQSQVVDVSKHEGGKLGSSLMRSIGYSVYASFAHKALGYKPAIRRHFVLSDVLRRSRIQ